MRYASLLFSPLLLIPHWVSAATYTHTAPVSEAVLFPSQAHLSRTLSQPLSAGSHTIVVQGLPELDMDALQIAVSGAVLLDSRLDISAHAEDISARRRALDETIAQLEQTLREYDNADRLDQEQIAQLQSLLGQGPQGQAVLASVPVEKWSQAWQAISAAVGQRQEALNARVEARRATEAELRVARTERAQLGSAQAQQGALVLTVQADKAATAEVSLRYFTRLAGWSNQLKMDLLSQEEQVNVSAVAEIYNRTGEDWQGVKTTLGLLPAGYRRVPEPSSWVVDLYTPSPRSKRAYEQESMADMAAPVAMMAEQQMAAAPAPVPVQHGFDMRVPLPVPLTVPSDGSRVRQPYQQATLPVRLARESYLWQNTGVMLVAEWENASPLPWLAGPVTVFRDGQRLTRLRHHETVELGETLRMGFGDDPRIQVEAVKAPSKSGEEGLISRENVLSSEKTVTISSSYNKPVTVQLFDRQPVAANEAIEVTLTGQAPQAKDVDDIAGLLRWDVTVESGQAVRQQHGYEVRYPSDAELTGM